MKIAIWWHWTPQNYLSFTTILFTSHNDLPTLKLNFGFLMIMWIYALKAKVESKFQYSVWCFYIKHNKGVFFFHWTSIKAVFALGHGLSEFLLNFKY